MIVYRLANKKYANDLSGIGAELTGGRWNFKGTRVLYTADSRALCTAEIAVHTPMGLMPKDYYLVTIELPEIPKLYQINPQDLPVGWRKFPHAQETQKLGDDFILKMEALYLKVPSAVVPGDFNILINPHHVDFKQVQILEIEKFDFDERLFK